MERCYYLEHRRTAALNLAHLTDCPQQRSLHEEQARAYAKIIDVLSREEREAVTRFRV